MAMDGLIALACAGALVMTTPPGASPPAATSEDRDSAMTSVLAVQTAMQQGRDFLVHNNPRAAVEALERATRQDQRQRPLPCFVAGRLPGLHQRASPAEPGSGRPSLPGAT